ncbi:MAG: ATPase P [Smithella sp.]
MNVEINVPGYKTLSLSFLVLDYNGTIACDGHLIPGIKELLIDLSQRLAIHILTADTFGGVKEELQGIPCEIVVIAKENQAQAKADHVRKLDEHKTVCIGNGRNDALMLKEAELGIAVIQTEGCAVDALLAADVVTQDIQEALNLLRHPLRLAATLRS